MGKRTKGEFTMFSKDEVVDFVYLMLESEDFETLLERFDLTPDEVFIQLFYDGLIDEELISEMMGRG